MGVRTGLLDRSDGWQGTEIFDLSRSTKSSESALNSGIPVYSIFTHTSDFAQNEAKILTWFTPNTRSLQLHVYDNPSTYSQDTILLILNNDNTLVLPISMFLNRWTDDRSIHKFFASKTLRHTNTSSIKITIFYIMKTPHNLNNDMHAHDCLFIHCEAYPLFHSYEAYPPFHSYVHALCFTIQTLYSYSFQIMLSSNTIN